MVSTMAQIFEHTLPPQPASHERVGHIPSTLLEVADLFLDDELFEFIQMLLEHIHHDRDSLQGNFHTRLGSCVGTRFGQRLMKVCGQRSQNEPDCIHLKIE